MIRIPSVLLPERVSVLLVSEFALSAFCFLGAHFLVHGLSGLDSGSPLRFLTAAASVVLGCYLNSLYKDLQWRSRVALVLQMCSVFGVALIVQGLLAYLRTSLDLSRSVMFVGVALNFALMVGWRILYASLLNTVFAAEPVLFLGADDVVTEIAESMMERPELGFSVAGFLSDAFPVGTRIGSTGEVVGTHAEMADLIARLRPKRIVVGTDEMRSRMPVAELIAARRAGIAVQEAGTAYELVCGRVCSRNFRPSQIIFGNELAARPTVMALQSIYTNVVGLIAYIALMPLLGVMILAIKLTSRGPALIEETWSGFNGIPFMASRLRVHVDGNPEQLTPVGRFIMACHLVFLPRVINLVRGEMALVGPDPERPEFAEYLSKIIPFYRQRQAVKPGMTGWTQIQSRPEDMPDLMQRIEYDLYYTKHISLPLDAYILMHTLRAMLPFGDR